MTTKSIPFGSTVTLKGYRGTYVVTDSVRPFVADIYDFQAVPTDAPEKSFPSLMSSIAEVIS